MSEIRRDNETLAQSVRAALDTLNPQASRRDFLKVMGVGAGTASLVGLGTAVAPEKAEAFAYEPYPIDDELTTVVTSCAHNCGSRHVLVAHKKGM